MSMHASGFESHRKTELSHGINSVGNAHRNPVGLYLSGSVTAGETEAGEDIRSLKKALIASGEMRPPLIPYPYDVNPFMSDSTERALRRFQQRHGLTLDGVVVPKGETETLLSRQMRRVSAATAPDINLKAPVGIGKENRPDDLIKLASLLSLATGIKPTTRMEGEQQAGVPQSGSASKEILLDPTQPSRLGAGSDLPSLIHLFQSASGLNPDGVVFPDGPTFANLRKRTAPMLKAAGFVPDRKAWPLLLSASIGPGQANRSEDLTQLGMVAHATGALYSTDSFGVSNAEQGRIYSPTDLEFSDLKFFQRSHRLEPDGLMLPGGPTEAYLSAAAMEDPIAEAKDVIAQAAMTGTNPFKTPNRTRQQAKHEEGPTPQELLDALGYETLDPNNEMVPTGNQITAQERERMLWEAAQEHNWDLGDAIYRYSVDEFDLFRNQIDHSETTLRHAKDRWVRENATTIQVTARKYGLPPELLAGIAWSEIGGEPKSSDMIGAIGKGLLGEISAMVQALDKLPLMPDLSSIAARLDQNPNTVSIGDVQIQARHIARYFGIDPQTVGARDVIRMSTKLEENRALNLDITAWHLDELRKHAFPESSGRMLTRHQIRVLGDFWNAGLKAGPYSEEEYVSPPATNFGTDLVKKLVSLQQLLKGVGS